MKTVSYKEYKKEVNKKKKNSNNSKTKSAKNTYKKNNTNNSVSTKSTKVNSSNSQNKKKTNVSKITQNIIEEKTINTPIDNKKEINNINNKKKANIYQENSVDHIHKENTDPPTNKPNLEIIIEKEELNNITDNDIKMLTDKELNQIIKSYEKVIKKETPKKRKKKRRIRWNNVTLLGFILLFLTIIIISSNKILDWLKDSNSSEKEIIDIQENIEIIETENNEQTEIIETPEEKEPPKTSPYWTYIEMNLIDVDFTELKEKNSDTAGWIQVNGTNINYPYVQTNNNEYYLTHSFDKTTNNAGWVFMDYRNNKYDFDKNTIIYAHSRKNNTMFGTLRKILKNGWLNNTNNHVIKLSTESENTLWQVFSVYRIPTTNDYIQVNFINEKEFINFGNMLIKRSSYNFNTSITAEDKILTLSTCYDDNDKVVLHAKLIKREKK